MGVRGGPAVPPARGGGGGGQTRPGLGGRRGRREVFIFETATLSEAQIPARSERALGGLIGAITQRTSTIHVLTNDFDRALNVASALLGSRRTGSVQTQVCYNCSPACSAFLDVSPSSKAHLIVDPFPAEEDPPAESHPAELKYCPVCDIEYGSGDDRCTVFA